MSEEKIQYKIYKKAQDYLSRRSYGTLELFSKLFKKFPEYRSEVQEVIDECIRLGFMDDERYALSYMKNRLQYRHKSLRTIQLELRSKGLDDISNTLISTKPELQKMEKEALQAALEKKIRQTPNFRKTDREVIQKLKASLYRKGFSLMSIEEMLETM